MGVHPVLVLVRAENERKNVKTVRKDISKFTFLRVHTVQNVENFNSLTRNNDYKYEVLLGQLFYHYQRDITPAFYGRVNEQYYFCTFL